MAIAGFGPDFLRNLEPSNPEPFFYYGRLYLTACTFENTACLLPFFWC
jgi:hypothetical protein